MCPICLADLDPRTVLWRDASGNSALGPPARPSTRSRWRARLLGGGDMTAKSWADWYAQGFRAYCPEHLGELPEDLFTRQLVVIGLVGESGSSKTHYLASLLHLLSAGALAPYQVIVDLEPGTVTRFQNEYYRRLWVDHEVIPASRPLRWFDETAGHREFPPPLTVVLRNWETGKAINVCIFDAAGEQLLTQRSQATWARHLAVADGLLFFVDPAILPGVQQRLGDSATGAGQSLPVTASVLDVTAMLHRRAKSLSPDDDTSGVASAMLLAKADLLVGTKGFPDQVLEPMDHRAEAPYRVAARVQQDSLAVAQYLEDNGGQNLVSSALHKFPGLTFHAVSATGCAPVNGIYATVEPQRVLEPFLLLLQRTGVLQMGQSTYA
jgi:hypothetical protein